MDSAMSLFMIYSTPYPGSLVEGLAHSQLSINMALLKACMSQCSDMFGYEGNTGPNLLDKQYHNDCTMCSHPHVKEQLHGGGDI